MSLCPRPACGSCGCCARSGSNEVLAWYEHPEVRKQRFQLARAVQAGLAPRLNTAGHHGLHALPSGDSCVHSSQPQKMMYTDFVWCGNQAMKLGKPRRVLCGLVVQQASLLTSFNRLVVALAKSQDHRASCGVFAFAPDRQGALADGPAWAAPKKHRAWNTPKITRQACQRGTWVDAMQRVVDQHCIG